MSLDPFDVTFFPTPDDFHAFLAEHHEARAELWVGFWKKATGRPSITWEESVDVALCFGWIDGIRKSFDDDAYTIRFTPRRRGSIWSLRNVERYGVMVEAGRVAPAGVAEWEKRTEARTGVYSHEGENRRPEDFDDVWLARLAAEGLKDTWYGRPPGWRSLSAFHVQSAKKPETRERRFVKFLEELRGHVGD